MREPVQAPSGSHWWAGYTPGGLDEGDGWVNSSGLATLAASVDAGIMTAAERLLVVKQGFDRRARSPSSGEHGRRGT